MAVHSLEDPGISGKNLSVVQIWAPHITKFSSFLTLSPVRGKTVEQTAL